MFVAAFIVHMGDPFGRVEKALLFLAVFVILMLTGPGKYSIDKSFHNKIKYFSIFNLFFANFPNFINIFFMY